MKGGPNANLRHKKEKKGEGRKAKEMEEKQLDVGEKRRIGVPL